MGPSIKANLAEGLGLLHGIAHAEGDDIRRRAVEIADRQFYSS